MPSPAEELAGLIAHWQVDPVAFVREAIGAEPWGKQIDILNALANGRGRVAVKAGHGVGKSAVEAWAVLWQLCCFDNSVIACTAPTGHQLYDVLWAEVSRWRNQLIEPFKSALAVKKDRISHIASPETWFAVARTARPEAPEGLQGFHVLQRHRLLIIGDEASGIPDPIFEVLSGAMSTDGVRAILCGNPTRPQGFFFETFRKSRHRWDCFTVSCLDAPPHIVSPDYAQDIAERFGPDSNVYKVRVLGEFPDSSDNCVVPLAWTEAALTREVPEGWFYACDQELVLCVDVARFGGDDTVVTARQGNVVMGMWSWHGQDVVESAARVAMLAKRVHSVSEERTPEGRLLRKAYYPRILIDAVGVGAGVADTLRRVTDKKKRDQRLFTVIDVNAGDKSEDALCYRKRDSLWWRAREWFRTANPVIAQPGPDALTHLTTWSPLTPAVPRALRDRITAELSLPTYTFTPNGLVKIESKDDLKARLGSEGKSPDAADSLNLGFNSRRYDKQAYEPTIQWLHHYEKTQDNSIWSA